MVLVFVGLSLNKWGNPEVLGDVVNNASRVGVTPTGTIPKNPKQFVILSFDGSESIPMWEATRNFAKEMKKKGDNLNFTYFVSGVYFLDSENKSKYLPPGHKVGQSAIGFSKTTEDIPKRFSEVILAQGEGNEIASHLNGHFDGSRWTVADWKSELEQFKEFVPIEGIVGVRTPLLAKNDNLYKVLTEMGYAYDASGVGKADSWPVKDKYGTWEFPLVSINIPGVNKSSLSMDYNIFLAQTGGKDILRRGSVPWQVAKDQVVRAYLNYFTSNYQNDRAPVKIGHHFSAWNGGVYWEAMKEFAVKVCGKPEVECATFSELVKYLERAEY